MRSSANLLLPVCLYGDDVCRQAVWWRKSESGGGFRKNVGMNAYPILPEYVASTPSTNSALHHGDEAPFPKHPRMGASCEETKHYTASGAVVGVALPRAPGFLVLVEQTHLQFKRSGNVLGHSTATTLKREVVEKLDAKARAVMHRSVLLSGGFAAGGAAVAATTTFRSRSI